MTQAVLCKLVIKDRYIYVVSQRTPQMNMPYINGAGEIRSYYGAITAADWRIEATNDPSKTMRNVPKLHDAFGDSKNFEPGKDYWYYVYVLPTGKLKTIMSGTVVCLLAENHQVDASTKTI